MPTSRVSRIASEPSGGRAAGSPAHLAVRAPSWLGDLVMATPVLRAAVCSERFERVSVLVPARFEALFEGDALAPHVRAFGSGGRGERALLTELVPDAVLLLTNSLGAAWRAFRARVPLRAGAALSGRGLLLTHPYAVQSSGGRRVPVPTARLLADVAGALGIDVPDLHPRLDFGAEAEERARRLLGLAGLELDQPYVVCAPGASFGAAKLWPPEAFAAVLDRLYDERGLRAVVQGGPGEEPLMDAVAERARTPVVSLAPFERDLAATKPLVARSRLVLVGDTGPRWLAAAHDVPCVTVMGPNLPELTATSLERCRVVRVEGLECAPCLRKRCPLGHLRCMRELRPETVLAAVDELLGPARVAG